MYQPLEWLDEVVEYPYRYTETDNGDGTIEHTPSPGEELQEGTPQSATNFNHMESGIHDAGLATGLLIQAWANMKRELDAELTVETGTVTLTNSASNFLFNDSGTTVALTTARETVNYDVEVIVTAFSGGQLGDIEVYDKALNGFKVKYYGSATSVTISYKVKGGMKS